MSSVFIRSGGQTGVDRAALDVAVEFSLPYAGWCPKGGWTEDYEDPPGIRRRYPHLAETPSADPRQRTAWNVRDASITLVVLPADGVSNSTGTDFTLLCAELLFERPAFVLRLGDAAAMRDARRWIEHHLAQTPHPPLTVNVAGPRESESAGIQEHARVTLAELFKAYASIRNRRVL